MYSLIIIYLMSYKDSNFDLYNYNLQTSEYPSGLINDNINNYYNNLLNVPEPPPVETFKFDWSKFYSNYIEHNLLFIVILIGTVIFLVIRYYTLKAEKDDDNDTTDNSHYKSKKKNKQKKNSNNNINSTDYDKQKILNIIDELSNINYEEKSYTNNIINEYQQRLAILKELQFKQDLQQKEQLRQFQQLQELQQKIPNINNNIYKDTINELNHHTNKVNTNPNPNNANKSINKTTNKTVKIVDPDRHVLDQTIKNFDTDSDSDSDNDSYFYKLKKNKKTNKYNDFDGLCIEPPYN